jgi:hypothetical protein
MNVVIPSHKFSIHNVFFSDLIQNRINKHDFIKIVYSNNDFILNTVFLQFTLLIINIENYLNKKTVCFNTYINNNIISEIIRIEAELLTKVNIINKIPIYKLKEHLVSGLIKFYNEHNNDRDNNNNRDNNKDRDNNIIIKISGIWVNNTEYGLKYKFINL